jgi:hypothetical protein
MISCIRCGRSIYESAIKLCDNCAAAQKEQEAFVREQRDSLRATWRKGMSDEQINEVREAAYEDSSPEEMVAEEISKRKQQVSIRSSGIKEKLIIISVIGLVLALLRWILASSSSVN